MVNFAILWKKDFYCPYNVYDFMLEILHSFFSVGSMILFCLLSNVLQLSFITNVNSIYQ